MVTGKVKFALWLTLETRALVEENYRAENCKSQSEYIEKAIEFYSGFLASANADTYLPRAFATVMEGKLTDFGDRLSKLLFKLLVEVSIMAHIIASDTDIDLTTLDRLRVRCVQDAMRTHGEIDFEDVLKFQKGLI